MKRLYVLILCMACFASTARAGEIEEDRIEFGPFGTLTVYRSSPKPAHVVLFVSGDGGWDLGVVDMARKIASLNSLVVGIDIVRYLKHMETRSEKCAYPAADFELLSKYIQKKWDYPGYVAPLLVGYSSGATLVYAVLAQAPPSTFQGAISMGFCPDLLLPKPLCRGSGLEWETGSKENGVIFKPARHLQAPWIAFQGATDEVCDPKTTESFVEKVNSGRLVLLPKVGHGFSVSRNWLPQLKTEFLRLAAEPQDHAQAPGNGLKDLPLVEIPADRPDDEAMAVVISGDGGWAGIDREIANALAGKGIPVVGLNSLKYFWRKKTPETAAADLERVLKAYMAFWKKSKAILIGYSLGADVLPFMANRLAPETLDKVALVALLGPDSEVDWEFHLTDWLGGRGRDSVKVLPEVERLTGKRLLCVYGEEETASLCPQLSGSRMRVVAVKGAHHFGGDYEPIAKKIFDELGE